MAAILGFHLLATSVFVLGSLVVGTRLVWLSRRTRQAPEALLGSAILGTAVFGYGLLIGSTVLRGGLAPEVEPSTTAVWMTAIGKTLHNAGVTCFLLFIVAVFRRGELGARVLAAAAALLLWGGMAWGGATGAFRQEAVGAWYWWCEYAVVWTYPVWLAVESLGYWRRLRRRRKLGLDDPELTNRFGLWGCGSIASGTAIWVASTPFYFALSGDLEGAQRAAPLVHVVTAIAGLVSVTCSYLAFLPPAWYRRRILSPATT